MTTTLYNEIDPYAAAWLRNLADAGHIAAGRIDTRSIADLQPSDVRDATRAHFFAGIGAWSHALRLAGWPDDARVWTGSCPCQPFSSAGKGAGFDDARHLWPAWFELIRECRPPVILGEQVASPDGLAWLDAVCADLEDADYAVGAADLCAAGIGAPHIRQRLYFVAIAEPVAECTGGGRTERDGRARDLADACGDERGQGRGRAAVRWGAELERAAQQPPGRGDAGLLGDPRSARLARRPGERGDDGAQREAAQRAGGAACSVGNADGSERPTRVTVAVGEREESERPIQPSAPRGFWSAADWIPCRDGKARPVEPGSFPLAHGATARVGRLRAYGNAICAPLAAEFVGAVMDVLEQRPEGREGEA